MKKIQLLLTLPVITWFSTNVSGQAGDVGILPERPDAKRDGYGTWLDEEGYIIPGPKTKDFVDTDRDQVDDRLQSAPGEPGGKPRPDRDTLQKPDGPTRPDLGGGDSSDAPKPARPERPARPELNAELKDKLASYKEENDKLRSKLKTQLKALSKPTREEIRQVTQAFQAANKERLDQQKQLAAEIKDGLKVSRPERPAKPAVSDLVSSQMDELRKQHSEIQKAAEESKRVLKETLADATKEERKQLLDQFREEQKQLHEELKGVQRQIRETLESARPSLSTEAGAERPERRRPPSRDDVRKTGDRRTSGR